jgi:antitoxin VapB
MNFADNSARHREISQKKMRIEHFLHDNNLSALIIGKQNNFAWATAGGANWVSISNETGVANLIFKKGGHAYAVMDNLETPRFEQEEYLGSLGFEVIGIDWWLDPVKKAQELVNIAGGDDIGADYSLKGTKNVDGLLARERYVLTPDECDRYREVCRLSTIALETTALSLKKGMTEWEIVGRMAEASYSYGLIPFVTLVATDERIFKHRHPIPTAKKLEKYAMLVLCAKAGGLIANLTRLVHFGKLPQDLAAKHSAVQHIDATFNLASHPDTKIKEVFKHGQKAYEKYGFPDEWRLHHQGGATGYAGREFHGRPDSKEIVQASQAFAWNPSIAGTKSEDTVLVTEEGTIEVMTTFPDSKWENTEVTIDGLGTLARPNIMIL